MQHTTDNILSFSDMKTIFLSKIIITTRIITVLVEKHLNNNSISAPGDNDKDFIMEPVIELTLLESTVFVLVVEDITKDCSTDSGISRPHDNSSIKIACEEVSLSRNSVKELVLLQMVTPLTALEHTILASDDDAFVDNFVVVDVADD